MHTTTETQLQATILNDLRRKSEELRDAAESIERTVETVKRHLDEGCHVNQLGELQSRGSSFDRICGERQTLVSIAMHAECESEMIELASTGTGTFFHMVMV